MSFLCVFGIPFSPAHSKMSRNSTYFVLLISTRTGTILGKMTSVVTIEAYLLSVPVPLPCCPLLRSSYLFYFPPFLCNCITEFTWPSSGLYCEPDCSKDFIWVFTTLKALVITCKSFKFALPFSGKFRRILSFPHFSISWSLILPQPTNKLIHLPSSNLAHLPKQMSFKRHGSFRYKIII